MRPDRLPWVCTTSGEKVSMQVRSTATSCRLKEVSACSAHSTTCAPARRRRPAIMAPCGSAATISVSGEAFAA